MIKFIVIFFTFAYFFPFSVVMMKNGISCATFVPLLICLFFYVGAMPHLMASRNHAKLAVAPTYVIRKDRVEILALSLFGLYFFLRFSFFTKLSSQGGVFAILSVMQSASQARYEQGFTESTSLVFQFGSIIFFCLMGIIGQIISNKLRLSWILILLFIVFMEMMEGSRARALIGITILLTEYALSKNQVLLRMRFRSYLLSFMLFFIVAAFIFFIPQYARVYQYDNPIEIVLIDKLPSYTIAIYEALAVWIDQRNLFSLDYGYNSFSGVLKLFGFTFQQGFYDFSQTSFGPTNIYTNMRSVLSDFGIIFSPIIYFFMGHLIGAASLKKAGLFSLLIVKISLIFILFPLYSPFIFANVIFGVSCLLCICTLFSNYKIKL